MVFGISFFIIWLLLTTFVPHESNPAFVVHEIKGCCHHQLSLTCEYPESHIAVIQARFIPQNMKAGDTRTSKYSVSLKDLDVKFSHQFIRDGIEGPIHVNSPDWHPAHIKNVLGRQKFDIPKVTPFPKFPTGLNFSEQEERAVEMPLYDLEFMDKDTIWSQPLFYIANNTDVPFGRYDRKTRRFIKMIRPRSSPRRTFIGTCVSYEALNSSPASLFSSTVTSSNSNDERIERPAWQFTDLRPYFNHRCSGKTECQVMLIRNRDHDQDLTQVCHSMPHGIISVKYLCYNSTSETTHRKCNMDIGASGEGFLMNPGYPDLYPGDGLCEWRLHVEHQKLLLVLFDLSLRGKEKLICRDQLLINDGGRKIFNTCGDHPTSVAVLTSRHQVNITLSTESRLAFPKRGFLMYYRLIGCMDPTPPFASYMVFRNATHAYFLCDLGHVFADTLSRERWFHCHPLDHTWKESRSYCADIRRYSGNSSVEAFLSQNPDIWPIRERTTFAAQLLTLDFFTPVAVLMALFLLNGIVLCVIYNRRSRLEELENETNQEMERLCGTPTLSSSFHSGHSKDFWSGGENEGVHEDLLTLTTLTLQASQSPASSFGGLLTRTMTGSHHHYSDSNCHYYQDTSSGSEDTFSHPYCFYRSTPV